MSKKKTDIEMILDMLKQYADKAIKAYEEEEDEEEETEEEEDYCYYKHDECEDHDGDCDCCYYWKNDCCELDDDEEEDEDDENLSKFITSVGAVLGGNMGLLVFDKSNKKDMEKLAAIFGEYAKRLS